MPKQGNNYISSRQRNAGRNNNNNNVNSTLVTVKELLDKRCASKTVNKYKLVGVLTYISTAKRTKNSG